MSRIRTILPRILIFALLLSCLPAGALAWPPEPGSSDSTGPVLASSLPLTVSGYAQLLFTGQTQAEDTFSIRRARLSLGGNILKRLRFKIQADLVRSPALLDAQAEVILDEKLNLRGGQFLVPFSLESTTSAGQLLTINRSRVVDLLAPGRDNGSAGRDIGLVVFGRLSIFNYTLGFLNGSGLNKKDDNEHKDFAGRLTANPARGLRLGFSVYNGRRFDTTTSANLIRNRYGLEASWHYRHLHLSAEYIFGRDDQTEKAGWYLLGAFDLKPDRYQLVLKLDYFNPDRSLPGQSHLVYTAGANWFLSPMSKVQANFEYHRLESGPDYRLALLQLQVGF
ncbi:MAG: OprO/OprP family phosphate-selective porin [Candidatus Saccharicenans sp.]|jgi:phosphate-selective porin|nr:OprO/OprP family phosphate-selective porin [Candidatus Saccharicenans sp.]MDH7493610.1 porin [Candidatus Saccharicenans sp.]